jgi:predicted component of type VI protein secretion system
MEQTLFIDPPGGLLGRSLESAICLPYDSVSRQHAEMRYEGQRWWLYQRSQSSLTLLDDQPLVVGGAPVELLGRGTLKLGRVALQYWQEAAPVAFEAPATMVHRDSEATMILPRRLSPKAIPTAMLAQMAPVRVAESAPPATPATMIRRPPSAVPPPPPLEALGASSDTPMTLIIRPGARPSAAAMAQPLTPPTLMSSLPVAEHQPPISQIPPIPRVATPLPPDPELAGLRSERDRLATEVTRLKRENEELRDARAALTAQVAAQAKAVAPLAHSAATPQADLTTLSEKALELLQPFGRNLEQAGEALRQGDATQARSLLRSASFALADLRDLFQP